jgi:hypothetical protein
LLPDIKLKDATLFHLFNYKFSYLINLFFDLYIQTKIFLSFILGITIMWDYFRFKNNEKDNNKNNIRNGEEEKADDDDFYNS